MSTAPFDNFITPGGSQTPIADELYEVEVDGSYVEIVEDSQKLLEKYNHVVDVNSLDLLGTTGWMIYGNKLHAGEVKGRPIAVIGDYKTGKTFMMIKLMNIQEAKDLSHPVWKTPGIGVVYPKPEKSSNNEKNFYPTISGAYKYFNQLRFGNEPPKHIFAEPDETLSLDFIIIDTEGTNAPVADYRLKDDYLKEQFLRKVELDLADDFIYLITKFTKNTINEINCLINDINLSHRRKNNTDRISHDCPLIVVHNLMHVEHKQTLKAEILEVQKCYHDQECQTLWTPRKDHENFYYFSTPQVDHYFLIRDSGEGAQYNESCIKSLQTRLRYLGKPRDFNFIEEFTKSANFHIRSFIPNITLKKVKCYFLEKEDHTFDAFLPFRDNAPVRNQENLLIEGFSPSLNIATISKDSDTEFSVTIPGCNYTNFGFEETSSKVIIKYKIMKNAYLSFEKDIRCRDWRAKQQSNEAPFTFTVYVEKY